MKLRYLLKAFSPSYWIQIYIYSPEWDRTLNSLLDANTFTNIGEYSAHLGTYQIWIANHPYASFRPYMVDVRPRRSTIARAYAQLRKDTAKAHKWIAPEEVCPPTRCRKCGDELGSRKVTLCEACSYVGNLTQQQQDAIMLEIDRQITTTPMSGGETN